MLDPDTTATTASWSLPQLGHINIEYRTSDRYGADWEYGECVLLGRDPGLQVPLLPD
jgi:hypothetical protein